MKKDISPYEMLSVARQLISDSTKDDFPRSRELQIILLLNKAEDFPNMSHYQLSFGHKALADLYDVCEMSGSALEHYIKALELYEKVPVKRIISKLKKIPREDLVYGIDGNICGEPDWENIPFAPKPDLPEPPVITDPLWAKITQENREQRMKEVAYENSIYDQSFEDELRARLEKLGEPYISEFYRNRGYRKESDTLSNKQLDLLTLEAMEDSYNYYKRKEAEK